jgi:hypothetical protein
MSSDQDHLYPSSKPTWLDTIPNPMIKFFKNLEDLLQLHEEVYNSMIEKQEYNDFLIPNRQRSHYDSHDHIIIMKISDKLPSLIERFDQVYKNYIINFRNMNKIINEQYVTNKQSTFGHFILESSSTLRLKERQSSCSNVMSFNSFLLQPIQRLMKYPLFLQVSLLINIFFS